MRPRTALAHGLAGTALALLLAGCAAHVPPPPLAVGVTSTLPRVALLPLENLSASPDATEHLSRVVVGVLGETGACQPVAPGDVEAAFAEFRIRDISGVTRDAMRQLGARLDADWLMAGTILECGSVRSPEGEVPSVGLTLRLYEAQTGRTAWTAMRVRTGEDRETLFGMGRVRSLDQLSEIVVRELLRGFRLPAPGDSLPLRGGS